MALRFAYGGLSTTQNFPHSPMALFFIILLLGGHRPLVLVCGAWNIKIRGRDHSTDHPQNKGHHFVCRNCACASRPPGKYWRFTTTWPAICDIWLGVRTVPVLSVAKEVAAPARSPTGRGAPEHRQVDANWLIDDQVSRNFWVLSVCWCFLLF